MEVILKTTYQIVTSPGRTAFVISSALAAVVTIFSIFAVFYLGDNSDRTGGILVGAPLSILTIAFTFLPGLYLRLYCYSRYLDLMQYSEHHDRKQKNTVIIVGTLESLNLLFLLNAYMAAITSGGLGFFGILAVAVYNLFWLAIAGSGAVYFYFKAFKFKAVNGLPVKQTQIF